MGPTDRQANRVEPFRRVNIGRIALLDDAMTQKAAMTNRPSASIVRPNLQGRMTT